MLTADEIASMIGSGQLGYNGPLRGDTLLLQIGGWAQRLSDGGGVIDVTSQLAIDQYYSPPTAFDTLVLQPGELVLCPAGSQVRLPDTVVGLIGTMSHLARLGLITHLDSPILDPGTDGMVTLELLNVGPRPLALPKGCSVAKVILFRTGERELEEVAMPNRGYAAGDWLGSRYANEFFGVVQ